MSTRHLDNARFGGATMECHFIFNCTLTDPEVLNSIVNSFLQEATCRSKNFASNDPVECAQDYNKSLSLKFFQATCSLFTAYLAN